MTQTSWVDSKYNSVYDEMHQNMLIISLLPQAYFVSVNAADFLDEDKLMT